MAINLRNRSFLTLSDYSAAEIGFLLKLAADLKTAKYAGTERPLLRGKEIALIFEKDSTRTRVGFEVAAHDQGATVTYLGPSGSHIGHKESIKDTARVLGRVYDAIEYRGHGQSVVETLARWSGVPVYNGLTDQFHPTQILADFMTMRSVSLMQTFTGIEKRQARAARYEREADAAIALKSWQKTRLLAQTAGAWFDRYFQEQVQALLMRQHDDAQKVSTAIEAAYRSGRSSQRASGPQSRARSMVGS